MSDHQDFISLVSGITWMPQVSGQGPMPAGPGARRWSWHLPAPDAQRDSLGGGARAKAGLRLTRSVSGSEDTSLHPP